MHASRRIPLIRVLVALSLGAGALLGTSLGARQLPEGADRGPQVLTTRDVLPIRPGDRGGRMTEAQPAPEGSLTAREEALLQSAREARREAGIEEEIR